MLLDVRGPAGTIPSVPDFRNVAHQPSDADRARLAGRVIHLWTARLDPPEPVVARLRSLLDEDERARADRFRFDVHRRRFTVGRGFQRIVLGAYQGLPPNALLYQFGPKGKPELAPRQGTQPLHFNLSNSEDLALLGVTREREIGVDVEHLRELSDLEALAERFFSRRESAVLLALPEAQRALGFFNCWTRKEAYLKAVGEGITAPLDRFDVTLVPGEPPRMLEIEGSAERAAAWSYYHLEPWEGFVGAVAIEGEGWEIADWVWQP
jgi:4'-phosphopantetheinyl transferase